MPVDKERQLREYFEAWGDCDGVGHAGSYYEMYRDTFLEKLGVLGIETVQDFDSLLVEMSKYSSVGDFLDDHPDLAQLSAFGLVLLSRMHLTGWGKRDFEYCFYLHEQVFECFEFVRDSHKRVQAARTAATKRYEKNILAKKFIADEWTAHAKAYEGNKSEFSRHYVRRVKNELDLEITEKQMREVWLKDTPSAGIQAG